MTGGRDGDWVWESMEDLLLCVENPRSAVDAAHRYLVAEVRRLRSELVFAQPLFSRRQLEAKLAHVAALPVKWRDDLAKFKATSHPTWQIDPTALIERATAAFCEELEAALRGDE